MVSQTSILVSVKIISIISMQNYLKMSDYSFSYNPPPKPSDVIVINLLIYTYSLCEGQVFPQLTHVHVL